MMYNVMQQNIQLSNVFSNN